MNDDDRGIITVKEGEAPPMEGVPGDIAKLAWAQSNGSIAAFEQLCGEHARGEIDLTAIAEGRPEDAVPEPKPAARTIVVGPATVAPAAAAAPAVAAPAAKPA
jgi:hypothetical protein